MNKNKSTARRRERPLPVAPARVVNRTNRILKKNWGPDEAQEAVTTDNYLKVSDSGKTEIINHLTAVFGNMWRGWGPWELQEQVGKIVAPIFFVVRGQEVCYEPSAEIFPLCELVIGPNWQSKSREQIARLLAPHIAQAWTLT